MSSEASLDATENWKLNFFRERLLDILCRLYVDYPVQSDRGFVCGALLQILRNELKDAAVVPDCRTFE